eukprot:11952011-Ditylum_brightwellii.AAC.1
MQTLAARAGYTANYICKDQVNKQTAEALAQIAEATSSDRAAVADLAYTNTQLMEQVANYTTKMVAKDTEIATLQDSIKKLTVTLQHIALSLSPLDTGFVRKAKTKK